MNDLDDLLCAHELGLLDQDGARRLAAALDDPAQRRRLVRWFRVSADLGGPSRAAARRPPLRLAVGVVLAACALITAAILLVRAPPAAIRLEASRDLLAAHPSGPVSPGTELATAASGEAHLRWPDGSRLAVGGGARIVVAEHGARVLAGTVAAEVAPRAKDAYALETPHGAVTVLGTGLAVAVERSTLVRVDHGLVRAGSGGVTIDLASGHGAVLGAGAPPIASAMLPLRAMTAGRVLRAGHEPMPEPLWALEGMFLQAVDADNAAPFPSALRLLPKAGDGLAVAGLPLPPLPDAFTVAFSLRLVRGIPSAGILMPLNLGMADHPTGPSAPSSPELVAGRWHRHRAAYHRRSGPGPVLWEVRGWFDGIPYAERLLQGEPPGFVIACRGLVIELADIAVVESLPVAP